MILAENRKKLLIFAEICLSLAVPTSPNQVFLNFKAAAIWEPQRVAAMWGAMQTFEAVSH